MKAKAIIAIVTAALACSSYAYSFKVNVDLNETAETNEVHLAVQKGAEKAAERYFRFAERTHPLVLSHSFAAKPEKAKVDIDDDPLEDLDGGIVAADAIQKFDKEVEYVVRATKSRKSFVLMVVNRKNENLKAEIELKRGKMREPVYRRVYSEDGGKTWTTMAWQPPRASDLYPWTIDVPSNTVQTVTIIIK